MKIAIDKNSISVVKKDDNEYIYLFDNEDYKDLLETGLHCIYYKNCLHVDINLTDYDIDCIKKAKINDKDYNKLPEKIDYVVTATENAVKGNTSSGAQKDATLENGMTIKVPLFINEGESVLVSTKDGKYVSRA